MQPSVSSDGVSDEEWRPSGSSDDLSSYSQQSSIQDRRQSSVQEKGAPSSTSDLFPSCDSHQSSLQDERQSSVQEINAPSSTSDLCPSSVSVSQTNNGKKWDKKHSCKFCDKLVIKMSDHLERVHSDKIEVAMILAMKKGSQERRRAWGILLNEGDFQHNYSVLESKQVVIIPKYRHERKTTDLVPCTVCKGMYLKKLLGAHIRSCGKIHNVCVPRKGKVAVVEGKMLTPGAENMNKLFFTKVISKMKDDEIRDIVMKDSLILKYGERLFTKKDVEEHTSNHISTRMRNLGHLVSALQRANSGTKARTLTEALNPQNFNTLLEGVKDICKFNASTNKFSLGSKALKIGYSLKRC